MSVAEWPDAQNVSLPTIVSSSDLFDGELFGDELIDIYNSTVGGDGEADAVSDAIPTLLSSSAVTDPKKKDTEEDSNPASLPPLPGATIPAAETAATAAAASADDGLGAFRPSTSFNDFTTLLGPSTTSSPAVVATAAAAAAAAAVAAATATTGVTQQAVAPLAVVAATVAPDSSEKGPNKRGLTGDDATTPSPKRKATGNRGRRGSGNSKKAAAQAATDIVASASAEAMPSELPESVPSAAPTSEEKDTPDPLSLEDADASPATTAPSDVPKENTPNQSQPAVQADGESPAMNEAATTTAATNASSSSESVTSAANASESDFKSIAQAAVSSLILNAGGSTAVAAAAAAATKPEATVSSSDVSSAGDKVDLSTAHIKALTGNNWVAACTVATPGVTPVPPVVDPKTSSNNSNNSNNANNNRARRQNLTPDERARQNRDRNREHARNTRLRKKAYVEELKRTLTELVAQRDTADFEKRQSAQRELEQREVRFRVIEEFLKLRGRNETNAARWAAILEDGFIFTLPETSYRKMVAKDARLHHQQTLDGASECMADSKLFSEFLQTLGDGSGTIAFQYSCDRKDFFMDGCNAVLEWTGTLCGEATSTPQFVLKGSVRGAFSPASNKLLWARMSFDTGAIQTQLGVGVVNNNINPKSGSEQQCSSTTSLLNFQNIVVGAASCEDMIAAQAAASQADALLDSLQMPRLPTPVPSAVTVVHPSSSSESSDKGETDTDESITEGVVAAGAATAPANSNKPVVGAQQVQPAL